MLQARAQERQGRAQERSGGLWSKLATAALALLCPWRCLLCPWPECLHSLRSTFRQRQLLLCHHPWSECLGSRRSLRCLRFRRPPRNLKIGIQDLMPPAQREGYIGATYQASLHYLSCVSIKFSPVFDLDYTRDVKPMLDIGKEVVMVTEFFDAMPTNLQEIGDGLYDGPLQQFAADMVADGNRPVWIRPMHEFNGDWYSWGTYLGGNNTPENFIRAFQHVTDVFRGAGAAVLMQLSYNCDSANLDVTTDWVTWWPGEEYVDMILCSAYNRAGTDEAHDWETFEQIYADAYARMAALPGMKPLGVAECSCNSVDKFDLTETQHYITNYAQLATGIWDKAQWFIDAFADFQTKFPRVQQRRCAARHAARRRQGAAQHAGGALPAPAPGWFFQNKDDGLWDLSSDRERRIFGELMLQYTIATPVPIVLWKPDDNAPIAPEWGGPPPEGTPAPTGTGAPVDPYAPPVDPYAPPVDPYAPPVDPYAPPVDPYAPPPPPPVQNDFNGDGVPDY
ncbi:glycoside hydrolase superfamily [Tribonema minus]|uniref:Glycoside hydrolase superfamily n=1 Tax=Tribonema minus TaxID=303371 RepID=A0A836CGX9_9STRA|nr:glycoside hydrolase superfamily [Tribonema minus]